MSNANNVELHEAFTPEALSAIAKWAVDYCMDKYGYVPGFEDLYSDGDSEGSQEYEHPWDHDMEFGDELMAKPNRSPQDVEEALVRYNRARGIIPRATQREEWAECSAALGIAYFERQGNNQTEREDNLDLAVKFINDALEVYVQSDFPRQHADMHNELGTVYLEKERGDRPENLAVAIESFQRCLTVYTEAQYPEERADVQEKLEEAYNEAAGMLEDSHIIQASEDDFDVGYYD